ncbi:MAG: hypothetical protein J6M12_05325, partial [Clostridia bacterium]|nr:hypothetical protein [Clostridia bacterium]
GIQNPQFAPFWWVSLAFAGELPCYFCAKCKIRGLIRFKYTIKTKSIAKGDGFCFYSISQLDRTPHFCALRKNSTAVRLRKASDTRKKRANCGFRIPAGARTCKQVPKEEYAKRALLYYFVYQIGSNSAVRLRKTSDTRKKRANCGF